MAVSPEIRAALADRLISAFASSDPPVEVSCRMEISPKSLPLIDMYPAPTPRGDAGFGEVEGAVLLTLRARINTPDHEAAQEVLWAFLDDEDDLCLVAAVAADPTLGDVVSQASAVSTTGFGMYRDVGGDGAFLGCEWLLTVFK